MKTKVFVPKRSVLEEFADAADVSVSDVASYYRWQSCPRGIEAVARHFPQRRIVQELEPCEMQEWDDERDAPAALRYLGQPEIPKPYRPKPQRGPLGLGLSEVATPAHELDLGEFEELEPEHKKASRSVLGLPPRQPSGHLLSNLFSG